jgi:thiol:disulfide interchange protein DsbD
MFVFTEDHCGSGLARDGVSSLTTSVALHTERLSAIMPPIPIREIVMRRLLCLLLLVLALPATATGLLESRPSSTLGSINNSADFLPVREAFQLSLVESTPQSIKLRFVATEGYYLYRHRFQFRADPADVALGTARLPDGQRSMTSTLATSRSTTAFSTWNCRALINAPLPWP